MFHIVTTLGHAPGHSEVTTPVDLEGVNSAVLLVALALPAALHAQGTRHSFVSQTAEQGAPMNVLRDPGAPHSDLALAFGGALGGIGGVIAGGYLGAQLEMAGGCRGDEWCGLGGAVLGAAIGSTVMIPAAVHLTNDKRGSLQASLAASAAALGGGVLISLVTQEAQSLLLVPLGQIFAAVATERRTSNGRKANAPIGVEDVR